MGSGKYAPKLYPKYCQYNKTIIWNYGYNTLIVGPTPHNLTCLMWPVGWHTCPIHPTRVDPSEALDDSTRFARSRSAPPEVKICEIVIHECFSFLKRDYKLESIRVTYLKGHSQLYCRADLDTSFPTLKRVPLNLKSKLRVEYLWKSASILEVFCSIFNRLLKYCFWVCFCSSYDIILSYLVKNSIDRVSKRTWKQEVGNVKAPGRRNRLRWPK